MSLGYDVLAKVAVECHRKNCRSGKLAAKFPVVTPDLSVLVCQYSIICSGSPPLLVYGRVSTQKFNILKFYF